ncbi:MAG TPA: Xaa-Pro peptidase family protein [Anaerolineae bacterium]|nr:Xaa-Pro peptidase family protein [Anaerolineae bacterium]
MNEARIQALQRLMSANGVECVALVPGANLRYFSGLSMHLSERPSVAFVPQEGRPALLLPVLEAPAARALLGDGVSLFTYRDEEGHDGAFAEVAEVLGLPGKKIGIEFLAMRALELRRIEQAAPGCRLLAVEPWLPQLRMPKDPGELEQMRRAARIAEAALERLLAAGSIAPGRTERQVAADLQMALLAEGSQAVGFAPIVVAGPNSAQPHAGPSGRAMEPGDLVVIDWGAVHEGYQSDLTRTFVLGQPGADVERIYDVVLAANQAGRMAARPGVPAQEVDRAARRVIALSGFGEYFVHRTGHGLGLETHEPPYMVEGNLEMLRPGMTFTVEPGIYLPGLGGVRIEDDVVITERGSETISGMPRELRIL